MIADYVESSASHTNAVLESMGCTTVIEPSGTAAISEIYNTNDYDIIITNNLFKGGFNGPDLLDTLKNRNNFNIPVIVLTTSYNQREHFIEELGFDEYMTKLLDVNQVKETFPKVIFNLKFTKTKN